MASWKAFMLRESQASMSGSVSASPRSSCGRTLPWAVHFSRPWPLGNVPVTSPGTTTTSHSRPLDLCAVSTLTVFSPPGSALSRPFSYWAAVRRKPRKASRLASPSFAAKEAATSRKLDRVSRRRAARACGDAERLHLKTRGGEDPVQDVHERVGERAAQIAQFGGEPREPYAGVGRERQPVVVPLTAEGCLQEGVQRVSEGDHLGRVDAFDGCGEPQVGVVVGADARVGHEQAGPAAQEGEVAGADTPARSGQQTDQ